MIARLIVVDDSIVLYTNSAATTKLSMQEAKDFLLNCDDKKYYPPNEVGLTFDISNDDKKTIAYVTDDFTLCICDLVYFREIMSYDVEYLTVKEYAELYGKNAEVVRRKANAGEFPGMIMKGKSYLIPKNAPYKKNKPGRK